MNNISELFNIEFFYTSNILFIKLIINALLFQKKKFKRLHKIYL